MKTKLISLLISCLILLSTTASGCSLNRSHDSCIKGMDISSVISLEQSGAVFYGYDGKPQDIFKTLSESGVNYIRARVWNDPYDMEGNGYGGGNCDAAKAAEIGRRAAKCGMKLLVDFHYSDFWADPSRQNAPKAWRSMTLHQKSDAVYRYTVSSLEKISASGAEIGMVQIGNEINAGLAGTYDFDDVTLLLQSASQAVRDFAASKGKNIRIAVHFAPASDREGTLWYAGRLDKAGLDYDVFGISYYPYWHGGIAKMKDILTAVRTEYGKETAVLETSYPYTLEDGDGFPNAAGESWLLPDYPASPQGQEDFVDNLLWDFTVQGQADEVRAVMNAVNNVHNGKGIGMFYWEGAWIPVGSDAEKNRTLWEKYGSGWASSFCALYDPESGGRYYGGSSWDNQAFFDHTGRPLDSLKAFNN